MSNANDDTSARLDALASELAQLRNRQEIDSASIRELARLGNQLMTAAITQQEAIRAFVTAAEEDRAIMRQMQADIHQMQTDVRGLQSENRQILEYLFGQQRNGNGGQGTP